MREPKPAGLLFKTNPSEAKGERMFGKNMQYGDVTLKAYTLEEVTSEKVIKGMSDHEVTQYTLQNSAATKEGEAAWYEYARENKKNMYWGIYLNNEFVGFVSLDDIVENHCAGAGMIIFDKSAWKKGVGKKALAAVLWYAVSNLNLKMLIVQALSCNEASVGLLRKCGFKIVGAVCWQDYRNGVYVHRLTLQWIRPDTVQILHPGLLDDEIPHKYAESWPKAIQILKEAKENIKYS
jgi:RimJ/RimL family protein N-acetyltransferase